MFTTDYGERHAVDAELVCSVAGIPGLVGGLSFRAHQSGEINDDFATFDTKDGQAHSVGRTTASKTLTCTLYANDPVTRGALEAWKVASKQGLPGAKRTLTVAKEFADGTPGMVKELTHCFPMGISDSGVGGDTAATYTVSFKYTEAVDISGSLIG